MIISQLLVNINKGTLEDLVPISQLKTTKDLNELKEKGYSAYVTESKMKEFFTDIDTSNVYATKSISDPYVYCDLNENIIVSLQIFGDSSVFSEEMNYSFKTFLKRSGLDKGDDKLIRKIIACPQHFTMVLLNHILLKEEANDSLYKTFIEFYKSYDFGTHNLTLAAIKRAISGKSKEQQIETTEKMKDLPDILTIYRGEGDESTPYNKAFSWTLDYNTAFFFACRMTSNGQKSGRVVKGRVKKEDVIEYLLGRGEEEVIILPEKVELIEIKDLLTLDDVSYEVEEILPIFGVLKHRLREIHFEHDTNEHGKSHTLRVIFLALLLSQLKGLEGLELLTLMDACLYHDSGRKNDRVDPNHGKKSYDKYKKENKENKDVEFLIKYHCLDDKIAQEALEEYEPNSSVNLWELYEILKDADALDRVRFGMRALDCTVLRNSDSELLTLIANQCLKHLKL